jgi:hypothetical protein
VAAEIEQRIREVVGVAAPASASDADGD